MLKALLCNNWYFLSTPTVLRCNSLVQHCCKYKSNLDTPLHGQLCRCILSIWLLTSALPVQRTMWFYMLYLWRSTLTLQKRKKRQSTDWLKYYYLLIFSPCTLFGKCLDVEYVCNWNNCWWQHDIVYMIYGGQYLFQASWDCMAEKLSRFTWLEND